MTESDSRKIRLSGHWKAIIVLVCLILLGGGIWVADQFRREWRAIALVNRLGGAASSHAMRPSWMPTVVDDEFMKLYERIVIFDLTGTEVTDADLQQFQGLVYLTKLKLDNTEISDEGLEHLQGARYLRRLSLTNTRVTEAGIQKLEKSLPACQIEWEPEAPQ